MSRSLLRGLGATPEYSPDCLRPTSGGKFPLCTPDEGLPCCIGLHCVENPKNKSEYRCGNKFESSIGNGDTSKTGGDYDFGHIWNSNVSVLVAGNGRVPWAPASSAASSLFWSVLIVVGAVAALRRAR